MDTRGANRRGVTAEAMSPSLARQFTIHECTILEVENFKDHMSLSFPNRRGKPPGTRELPAQRSCHNLLKRPMQPRTC